MTSFIMTAEILEVSLDLVCESAGNIHLREPDLVIIMSDVLIGNITWPSKHPADWKLHWRLTFFDVVSLARQMADMTTPI